VDQGMEVLSAHDDRRGLARAFSLSGWVHGGRWCDHTTWAESAARALEHYKAAKWPTTSSMGELAAALYWGPTPVTDAVRSCEALLRDEVTTHAGTALLNTFLGGLAGQLGDFERGRSLVKSARLTLEDLGLGDNATTYCAPVLAEVELLADRAPVAERLLRELCVLLESANQLSRLASAASELADTLTLLGSFDEAEHWTEISERHTSPDDLHARIRWYPVRARIHAHRGELGAAKEHAREGVRLADTTDDLNRRARAYWELGRILRLAPEDGGAERSYRTAIDLFQAKGNLAGAALIRSQHGEPALIGS